MPRAQSGLNTCYSGVAVPTNAEAEFNLNRLRAVEEKRQNKQEEFFQAAEEIIFQELEKSS